MKVGDRVMRELKSCPFCGRAVDSDENPYPVGRGTLRQVACPCGAAMVAFDDAEAIAAWNTRAKEDEGYPA